MPKLPDYGIDAPLVVRNNITAALLIWAVSGSVFAFYCRSDSDFASSALIRGLISGAFPAAVSVVMVWSSKVGKFWVRDRLLNSIVWHGNEQVLDIGCERGLALPGAAKRLSSGLATGIDLWRQVDLSNNSKNATFANADAEGVMGRIAIEFDDARDLPFQHGAFDIALAMTAIHNIKNIGGRQKAIVEAVRVLKPGGRLAIFDIFHAGKYRKWLVDCGMQDVKQSGFILVWMIPGRVLTRRKPVA